MKRFSVLAIACVAVVALCSISLAAGTYTPPKGYVPYGSSRGGSGTTTTNQFFVLVQLAGDDVSCTLYTTMAELNKQAEVVHTQNVEAVKANKPVEAEIRKLRGEVTAKTKELGKAPDDDAKAEIQKAIDTLKAQIAQKQTELKPVVKLVDPRRFGSREDAEKFMEQTYKEAEKIKEKKLEKAEKKGSA